MEVLHLLMVLSLPEAVEVVQEQQRELVLMVDQEEGDRAVERLVVQELLGKVMLVELIVVLVMEHQVVVLVKLE